MFIEENLFVLSRKIKMAFKRFINRYYLIVEMNIEDFVNLGLKDYGQGEVLEIYWLRPDRDLPHLKIDRVVYVNDRVVHGISVDPNFGERGFLLGYYLRLVRELPEEYRRGNVELPFIEVCPTKERNGVPNNNRVQIPLSYIQGIIQLGKKA